MTEYEFSAVERFSRGPTAEGPWVRVTGGGLPVPVELRVSASTDGRRVVTGVLIGDPRDPREITSRMLHSIRLGDMLAQLFDRQLGADLSNNIEELGGPAFVRFLRATVIRAAMVVQVDRQEAIKAPSRRPPDDALRAFASTYLAELARNNRNAMSAAARAHDISRTSANRWADRCRRLGYLPQR